MFRQHTRRKIAAVGGLLCLIGQGCTPKSLTPNHFVSPSLKTFEEGLKENRNKGARNSRKANRNVRRAERKAKTLSEYRGEMARASRSSRMRSLHGTDSGVLSADAQNLASAVESDPENRELQKSFARLLIREGQLVRAFEVLDRLTTVPASDAEVESGLATVWLRLGSGAAALFHARQAVRIDPSTRNLELLGRVYFSRGEFEMARGPLQEALLEQPDNPELLVMLGKVASSGGDLEAAIRFLDQASSLNLDSVDLRQTRAQVLVRLAQDEQAMLELAPVMSLVQAHLFVGKAQLKAGRWQAARRTLSQGLVLAPGHEEMALRLSIADSHMPLPGVVQLASMTGAPMSVRLEDLAPSSQVDLSELGVGGTPEASVRLAAPSQEDPGRVQHVSEVALSGLTAPDSGDPDLPPVVQLQSGTSAVQTVSFKETGQGAMVDLQTLPRSDSVVDLGSLPLSGSRPVTLEEESAGEGVFIRLSDTEAPPPPDTTDLHLSHPDLLQAVQIVQVRMPQPGQAGIEQMLVKVLPRPELSPIHTLAELPLRFPAEGPLLTLPGGMVIRQQTAAVSPLPTGKPFPAPRLLDELPTPAARKESATSVASRLLLASLAPRPAQSDEPSWTVSGPEAGVAPATLPLHDIPGQSPHYRLDGVLAAPGLEQRRPMTPSQPRSGEPHPVQNRDLSPSETHDESAGDAERVSTAFSPVRPIDPEAAPGGYTIQVGAFRAKSNANRLQKRLSPLYDNVRTDQRVLHGETFHTIQVGRAQSRPGAESLRLDLVNGPLVEEAVIVVLQQQEALTHPVESRTAARPFHSRPDQGCEFREDLSGLAVSDSFLRATETVDSWSAVAVDGHLEVGVGRRADVRVELAGLSSSVLERWWAGGGWTLLLGATVLLALCARLTSSRRRRLASLQIVAVRSRSAD